MWRRSQSRSLSCQKHQGHTRGLPWSLRVQILWWLLRMEKLQRIPSSTCQRRNSLIPMEQVCIVILIWGTCCTYHDDGCVKFSYVCYVCMYVQVMHLLGDFYPNWLKRSRLRNVWELAAMHPMWSSKDQGAHTQRSPILVRFHPSTPLTVSKLNVVGSFFLWRFFRVVLSLLSSVLHCY